LEPWLEKVLWGCACAVLVVHLGFRVRAQRGALDEEGNPAPFRLRFWPPESYASREAARSRDVALWTGLLFAVALVAAMVVSYARGPG
jgi:hypothetical protein